MAQHAPAIPHPRPAASLTTSDYFCLAPGDVLVRRLAVVAVAARLTTARMASLADLEPVCQKPDDEKACLSRPAMKRNRTKQQVWKAFSSGLAGSEVRRVQVAPLAGRSILF
mgnify:CR=1 FL=1